MRIVTVAPVLALVLSACGGGGVQSASSCGLISGSCTGGGTPTPTPTPTPSGTSYSPVVDTTGNSEQTYTVIGGTQVMKETTKDGVVTSELYVAQQSASGIAVSYDPRGAAFTVSVSQADAGIDGTFQDPAHRTYYGGAVEPQASAPDNRKFANGSVMKYLQTGVATDTSLERNTFFYQDPATKTRYVSLAGYVRQFSDGLGGEAPSYTRARSVFAFGNQTLAGDVPTTGTATYTGNMLGTMAFNNTIDDRPDLRTRFEWISGTAGINVNFGAGTVTATFKGVVQDTPDDFGFVGDYNPSLAGQAFDASGTASFDTGRRGYTGKITAATLGAQTVDIAGSSLDGAFFGPGAAETGGAFRIVGGIPDQRVDILGAFTAGK